MLGPFLASCWPFMVGLIGLCGLSIFVKNERHAGTALILLLNWALCSGVVLATGDPYPFSWFIAVDWVSAVAVVAAFGFPTWPQRIVVLIFAVELICHSARGYVEFRDTLGISVKAANYYGYYVLRYAAWGQLAVGFAWGIHDLLRVRGGVGGGLSPRKAGDMAGASHPTKG